MKYKALMCDYDGTLAVSSSNAVPTEVIRDSINKASKKLHVGIATGRPLHDISHIFSHLQLSGPSIVNDGARIVDVNTGKILREQCLNIQDVQAICTFFKQNGIPGAIMDGEEEITDFQFYNPKRPFNIFSSGLDKEKLDLLEKFLKTIPTIVFHQYISWENRKFGWIISHPHATKQYGILEVAQILKISTQEIIGIGDGYNDFPLLMACGLKIAMGNAIEDLKEIADYVAPTVEEDGVAHVIEKFILQNQ